MGAYALDSRMLVVGGIDGGLRLWDRESGACLRVWQGHHGHVFALALAPDGRSLASGGGYLLSGGESRLPDNNNGSLRIWDVPSGACRQVLQGHRGPVWACAFARDGRSLVSGGDDGTLRLWDSESGQCLRVLKGHHGPIRACACAPDGRTLVSASDDASLRLWDAHSGQCLRVLQGHQGGVRACAFSPDGRRLLSASHDGTLRLWDAQSGDCLMVLCADDTGTAAWRPQPIDADGRDEPKRLLHASGEMWRHLAWLVPDEAGALQRLPLETFGDVVQP